MTVVTMVMVVRCGKSRTGNNNQQKYSGEKLFHAMNVARKPRQTWLERGERHQDRNGNPPQLMAGSREA